MTSSSQSEVFRQYLRTEPKGHTSLNVPEGRYKGWVPRCLYDMSCTNVSLPFLKLISFPVGGSSLGTLVDMVTFSAVGNYLSRLPESFGKCQNLVELNLSYNNIERIPSSVFSLTNLAELDLSENDISDLSPSIGNLKNLKILNLSGNLFEDLPSELRYCEKLEKLDVSRKWYPYDGGFTVLPEAVCYLTQLTYLDVSWHKIATITDDIRNMSKLKTLRMRGNNLRNVSKAVAECKALQYLDLTGAMRQNSYIPPEIFTLPELLILDITNNFFTEISTKIVGLKKLKKLIIRRNSLLRIPEEIFKMESLEAIDFSENYLKEIPGCISELETLRHVNLSCNKIEVLPDEICDCAGLTELQLHYNVLERLPNKIHKLQNLEELMLEGNKLTELPLMMDKLEKLSETERLSVFYNNLKKPPQAICDQGVHNIYDYLKELRVCEATHRKKLILIGASMAGKTSLRNVLLLGKAKLTELHERTWVMEQHLWEPEPDLRVQLLDFGGHHIYSAAHHMFLTPEALHVLVFDLSSYTPDKYDNMVGDWLDSIMDRAPGATIMVVGTHADLCTKEQIAENVESIKQRMHQEENGKLQDLDMQLDIERRKLQEAHNESGQRFPDLDTQRLQERVNRMMKLRETRITLPNNIYVVSCADSLSGIIYFHEDLTSNLKSSEPQLLPDSWLKFLTQIQERPEKILLWSEALQILDSLVKGLSISYSSLQGSAEKSLETVLRYLHATGEIVWYHDNPKLRGIVFHHPETLVEMLRAIFRHDFNEVVNYVESYGQLAGLTRGKFDGLKTAFLQRGLMTTELLNFCLQHFSLSLQSQDIFVDLMLKFDLCYKVEDSTSAPATMGSERILQFPWFLPTTPIPDLDTKWPDQVPSNTIELRYQLQFLKKGLPNFFEKMSARLQGIVTQREDWKDGILATRNNTKLLLTRKKIHGPSCITLSVRGAELQELWFLVLNIRSEMLTLLKEWPFVKVDEYMVCAHCILTGEATPYLWRGEILNMKCPKGIYEIKCSRNDARVPSCLVYPLDPEFSQSDIGRHITIVTDFLRSISDSTDGGGLLTDLILLRIAAKLGVEWITVALELGLIQAQIEHIQMDNEKSNTHRHIFLALIKWRDEVTKASGQEDLIEELLEAITNANRADLALELREQYVGN
ncbi:malignant fibrous histiocytoma-amplified sequence 1 homolog isoform X2 [Mya arenaria]|uniref:malignant fibrous histiocytoma-amplified sequence 1 homolog isoform X2 n=1 Tax=Mya arenaria TaxID=6604 RepID=UPI0022E8C988|nr:malignant fibrous histiocytoma-amplified sequence 1 homolog isoform X2 [Mya arenaria]